MLEATAPSARCRAELGVTPALRMEPYGTLDRFAFKAQRIVAALGRSASYLAATANPWIAWRDSSRSKPVIPTAVHATSALRAPRRRPHARRSAPRTSLWKQTTSTSSPGSAAIDSNAPRTSPRGLESPNAQPPLADLRERAELAEHPEAVEGGRSRRRPGREQAGKELA